jgi:hypothetical protein
VLCSALWLVRRGDLAPKFVEGDAVEEGGRLDHQTLVEPHEPRVGVLVGLPVEPCTFPVSQDDHGVAVGVDPAHGHRSERLREPGAERLKHLPDELVLAVEGL